MIEEHRKGQLETDLASIVMQYIRREGLMSIAIEGMMITGEEADYLRECNMYLEVFE